ncbi:hypothetical protein ACWDKQ_21895 [Saccharopolyspora sp. NPDC000995]
MTGILWWLIGGVFAVGFAASALITRLTRDPVQRAQRAALRKLWALATQLPTERLLTDPATGQLIGIERRFGLR